jgi:hypothetical protein
MDRDARLGDGALTVEATHAQAHRKRVVAVAFAPDPVSLGADKRLVRFGGGAIARVDGEAIALRVGGPVAAIVVARGGYTTQVVAVDLGTGAVTWAPPVPGDGPLDLAVDAAGVVRFTSADATGYPTDRGSRLVTWRPGEAPLVGADVQGVTPMLGPADCVGASGEATDPATGIRVVWPPLRLVRPDGTETWMSSAAEAAWTSAGPVVRTGDGAVALLGPADGRVVASWRPPAPATALAARADVVLVGTEAGDVVRLRVG